jgi:AraC-like DNA-binding protein
MKPVYTNISSLLRSSVIVVERDEPHFSSGYHAHPEFELVYIMEGFGKRIIGNKIDEFKKDDIVLIGPNVPHVWTSHETFKGDNSKRSKALVVYFNPKIFSDLFYEMEETRQLKALFTQAEYGVEITETAKKHTVLKLKRIAAAKGLNKIILLLDILNHIANATGFECINKQIVLKQPQASDRLAYIFDYVNFNFKKDISLKEAAQVINLTPESFCRFFKQKTGKKFIDYVHETRVFYAAQSLINTDLTVAEIAYNTGFKTASNFNKLFKKINGYRPTEYRQAIARNII